MEIKYVNGVRTVFGDKFTDATERTATLAQSLAERTKRTVRSTLPNGIRYTVGAK